MSAFEYVQRTVIPAAHALLPAKMHSPEATAMLLAIMLQESRATHRRQIGGPAKGLWQFEHGGGVHGVLNHVASRPHISAAMRAMAYGETEMIAFEAIEHNDVLACVFARLLLWTHPKKLPQMGGTDYAWDYYLTTWRPGRPHRQTWTDHFRTAWAAIT